MASFLAGSLRVFVRGKKLRLNGLLAFRCAQAALDAKIQRKERVAIIEHGTPATSQTPPSPSMKIKMMESTLHKIAP